MSRQGKAIPKMGQKQRLKLKLKKLKSAEAMNPQDVMTPVHDEDDGDDDDDDDDDDDAI